jgi:hypothetical protein
VKRDDHQPPALFERINRVGDELIQPLQFAVYRYAKRLESFCRRMNAPVTFRMNAADNQIGKLPGSRDGRYGALSDNATSYSPRCPLFTILKDDVGQFTLAEIIN